MYVQNVYCWCASRNRVGKHSFSLFKNDSCYNIKNEGSSLALMVPWITFTIHIPFQCKQGSLKWKKVIQIIKMFLTQRFFFFWNSKCFCFFLWHCCENPLLVLFGTHMVLNLYFWLYNWAKLWFDVTTYEHCVWNMHGALVKVRFLFRRWTGTLAGTPETTGNRCGFL